MLLFARVYYTCIMYHNIYNHSIVSIYLTLREKQIIVRNSYWWFPIIAFREILWNRWKIIFVSYKNDQLHASDVMPTEVTMK